MTLHSKEIFDVLKLLIPFDVKGHKKRRVGGKNDGGYVMFDTFEAIGSVYSFGIGWSVELDEDFANMGKKVYMFDHTIESPPREHQNFRFSRRGISAVDDADNSLLSLETYLNEIGDSGRSDLILKMDVEGAEWDVLSTINPATLGCFQQVVIEAHWLHRLTETTFRMAVEKSLNQLNNQFFLGHIHANNNRPVDFIDGFAVADVLELTYIRKDLAEHAPSTQLYPQDLDASNDPSRPDHLLWFFPFLPLRDGVVESELKLSIMSSNKSVVEQELKKLTEEISFCENRIIALRKLQEAPSL